MFVFIKSIAADVSWGLDTSGPDCFASDDSGLTWYSSVYGRMFIHVDMRGLIVGDITPTTVNTIEIPTETDTRLYSSTQLTTDAEKTIKTVNGSGYIEYLDFKITPEVSSHRVTCMVYCDGKLSFLWDFLFLDNAGYSATTDRIQLTRYLVDGLCNVHLTLKFSFKRELKITMQRLAGSPAQTVYVEG